MRAAATIVRPIFALFDWRPLAAYHAGGVPVLALAMVVGREAGAHPQSSAEGVTRPAAVC